MKKLFLKIMALVLGLNVFTACYGPAPYPDDYNPEDEAAVAQTDVTKAASEEAAAPEETGCEGFLGRYEGKLIMCNLDRVL